MTNKDGLRFAVTATLLLWLGLMLAPAVLADEAWLELEHPSLDALYASSRQPSAQYRAAKLDAVSVWFPDATADAARHAEELRQLTGDYFEAAIVDRGLALTGSGSDGSDGNGVVIVRVQLIDLRALAGDGNIPDWAANFRFRVAAGRVTLVAELVDAVTGKTVLRMADLQDIPTIDTPAAVDRMVQHWGDIVAQHAVVLPGALQLAGSL